MPWPPTTHQDVQDAIGVLRSGLRVATATKPNGTLAALDTGQPIANFGNAPLTVAGGYWTHTPLAGSNSAGYGEIDAGGAVGHIGATFRFPSVTDPNTTVTFVTPSAPWSGAGFLSNAAAHFTITPTAWNYSLWVNGSGQLAIASGTHTLAANTDYDADVYFNGSTATFILPDGVVRQVTDARIASWMGTTGVFECYELNGVGATPAKISAARLDPARGAAWSPSDGAAFVARSLAAGSAVVPKIAVTGAYNTTVSGTAAEIGGGQARLTCVIPSSGVLLAQLTTFLDLATNDNILGYPVLTYTDGSGTVTGDSLSITQAACHQQFTITGRITGTPGKTVVLSWSAFQVGTASAIFRSGGAQGVGYVTAFPAS